MPHYKLTYFDLRGRAEPIRMMLAMVGVPFEDIRIQSQDWPELKKTTPFGTLPTLSVDGVQVGQSLAILRYLAREFGYAGTENLSSAKADALCDQYADVKASTTQWHLTNIGYLKGDKDAVYDSIYVPAKAKNFPYFEAALEQSSTGWYADTPDPTHADFFIAANLEMLTRLDKSADKLFDGYPRMEAQYKKFFAQPKLQKYLEERPGARF